MASDVVSQQIENVPFQWIFKHTEHIHPRCSVCCMCAESLMSWAVSLTPLLIKSEIQYSS